MTPRTLTYLEWFAEGDRLFGKDALDWRFVCPSCGHVAAARDWIAAGAEEGHIAFSCVQRWAGGPCSYAGGGLFKLNPVTVLTRNGEVTLFEFAPAR